MTKFKIPTDRPPVSLSDFNRADFKFSDHRAALRAWLKSGGNPSSAVNSATKNDFAQAVFDWGTLDGMDGEAEQPKTEQPKTEKPSQPSFFEYRDTTATKTTTKTETEKKTMTDTTKTSTTADTADQAAQLAALLAQLMGKQDLDESRVIELIKTHSAAPVVQSYTVPDQAKTVKIEGAHEVLPKIVKWLGLRVPVYLVGAAGSGKSTIARQAAEALGVKLYQYGALMTKYDLDCRTTLQGVTVESQFMKWVRDGGVLFLDEIDGSQAAALVQWNDAIRGAAGTPVTFSNGEVIEKHQDCMVIAAANTVGNGADSQYVGRFRLDKATLNGFIYIRMDYSREVTKALSRGNDTWAHICEVFRNAAAQTKSGKIISPRQNDFGSRYLGTSTDPNLIREAVEMVIKGDLDRDQWQNLVARAESLSTEITRYNLAAL